MKICRRFHIKTPFTFWDMCTWDMRKFAYKHVEAKECYKLAYFLRNLQTSRANSLFSLLNDWNYFWNKYCNLPFLAICRSLLPLLIFLASSWYQKAKIGLRMSLQNKKMINYHIKGLYKTTCYKTKSNFSQFFFSHWLLYKCFFSFLIKGLANFEKVIRFYR